MLRAVRPWACMSSGQTEIPSKDVFLFSRPGVACLSQDAGLFSKEHIRISSLGRAHVGQQGI